MKPVISYDAETKIMTKKKTRRKVQTMRKENCAIYNE